MVGQLTLGFSVHVAPVLKNKMDNENGAGEYLSVTNVDLTY